MKLDTVDVEPMRLAGVWHRGPYERISETFVTLFPRLDALGLNQEPDSTLVAVYHDDPGVTPEDELRSFAAVTVTDRAHIGELHEVRLPGGRFLRAEFIGPHSQLAEGWRELGRRLAKGDYRSREGESFEIYVDNDEDAPSDQVRTDLYLPVA